ncbi:MAG: hypothetical protein DRJ42_24625 [Deltaproteobacteria bacterium]|nr:MAG: hypothetical protein DRJ42_24625 [Deltaproteobacteria bacterium]
MNAPCPMMRAVTNSQKKRLRIGAGVFGVLFVMLLTVPAPTPAAPPPASGEPFVWGQDDLFRALEARFDEARGEGCERNAPARETGLADLEAGIQWLATGGRAPDDPLFDELEHHLFAVAPLVAACPVAAPAFTDAVSRLRTALKRQSRSWDVSTAVARRRVYRLLYGSRTAVEEVLLQGDPADTAALIPGTDEPSATPSVQMENVDLHSGDILVSRGGAPTSALIARGNDYPGNFSHIAFVHVSEEGTVSIIEAHIEVGVVVSPVETYLADKKLRVLLLRLAHDLPAIEADPMLPHRAATRALEEARTHHVPYDFAMNYDEPSKMFCSEVASAPYADLDVHLWEGLTSMSGTGVASWLASFGVERFETHGPSDLEYDPQVVVVAEWRDPETLFDDHVDNAILDAMLEGADRGDEMEYSYPMLPVARLAKAYSATLNLFGAVGPVPEGMSATTALRAEWLSARHGEVKVGIDRRVAAFREEHGYTPPYWDLLAMARESLAEVQD